MWVQLLIFKLHFSIFVCPIKFIAKRKLEISDEKDVTVYTEDDGTEIDEDTFSAFDSGSTFISRQETKPGCQQLLKRKAIYQDRHLQWK